jgi:O-antigen/teichoic acid export membrane protein
VTPDLPPSPTPTDAAAAPGLGGRIRGGTLLLVLGRLWGSACTFLTLWLVERRLGDEDFGRYTFYLAAFMLLDSLVDFGTGAVAVQRTAGEPGSVPEVLAAARRIRLVAGALGVAIVGGGAFLLREPDAGWILLASLYPVTHVYELSATVFRNRIAWGVPVAVRAYASAASLAAVLALLGLGARSPGLFLAGLAAGSASANLVLHRASRPHLPRERAREVPWRPVLLAAAPLGLAGLCQQAYFYVDNLFVRALVGRVELGHYNVAVRVLSIAIMVAVYAALVALPWLKREHAAGRLGPAVARLGQPLVAAAGLGAGLLAPQGGLLLSIFGPEFRAAAPSLAWLLAAAVCVHAGAPAMTALVATGRTGSVLRVAAAGLVVNLVGNALLVPRLGIDGAAIATLATEGGVVLGALIALSRAGVRGLGGAAPWRWALGPALFAAGWWISDALALEAWVGLA